VHRFVLSPLRDGEESERVAGGEWWLTVVFNAAPCIQQLHPAARFPIFHPGQPRRRPLVARLAILDALRRPRERDSCGEIELNLEMNIESNELSSSQSASQPASHHPRATPSASSTSSACREAGSLRPLSPFGSYWHDRLVSHRNLFICSSVSSRFGREADARSSGAFDPR